MLAAYDAACGAADRYLRSWRMVRTGLGHPDRETHKKELVEVGTTAKALEETVRQQLTDLEKPIAVPGRRWWQIS